MSTNIPIANRLRLERERLGLSQTAFAEKAGSTRRSQTNYEKGERSPDSNYLAAAAKFGVDVQYVLTGQRIHDVELKQMNKTERAKAVLGRVIEVQEELGLEFTPDQIQSLMGYTFQYCPTKEMLIEFVRAAYAFTGNKLK